MNERLPKHMSLSAKRSRVFTGETLEIRLPLNGAPVATADAYAWPGDARLVRDAEVGLLANDGDPDLDALQIVASTSPQHGTLTLSPQGAFEYQPEPGYVGLDTFEYQVSDGQVTSAPARVMLRSGSYEDHVLADAPLGYWRLGEADDSAAARDASGNGNDGVYSRAQVGQAGAITGDLDPSALFPLNTESWIGIPGGSAIERLQNKLTIEAWVKPSTMSGLRRIFVNSQDAATGGFGFGLIDKSLIFTGFSVNDWISKPVLTSVNQWYHVAVVLDASNDATFYLNGQAVNTVAGNSPPGRGTRGLLIGINSYSTEPFHGQIDEVAVYGTMLTGDQLREHYEAGSLPVGAGMQPINDSYSANQNETLVAEAAYGSDERATFDESFSAPTIARWLEDPGGAFAQRDGVLQPVQFRRYLRTKYAGYAFADWTLEVDLDLRTTQESIEYIGIGAGVPSQTYEEPSDSLMLRFHSAALGGMVGLANAPASGETIGSVTTPGIHRIRWQKLGNELTIEVDAHFDGTFRPDITHVERDYLKLTPFLNGLNGHLFVGGSTLATFDNLRVVTAGEPMVAWGVLDNDLPNPAVLPPAAQLVEAPEHGTLELQPDGTFRYTAAPGFTGEDSFVYRLDTGVLQSTPAIVTLIVNAPPIAHDDAYVVNEDERLMADGPSVIYSEAGFNDGSGWLSDTNSHSPYTLGGPIKGQGGGEPHWLEPWQSNNSFSQVTPRVVQEGDGALWLRPTSSVSRRWQDQGRVTVTVQQQVRLTAGVELTLHLLSGNQSCGCDTNLGPALRWDDDGSILVADEGVWHKLNATWIPDHWYEVLFEADQATEFWRVIIDGQPLATPNSWSYRQPGQGSATRRIAGVAYDVSGASGGAYVDAVRVTGGNAVASVIANDSDVNQDRMHAVLVEGVTHGTLVWYEDGRFSYQPAADFTGVDQFQYRASDTKSLSEVTTVTIQVLPVNDAPIGQDDTYAWPLNGALQVDAAAGVLINDRDADSLSLSVQLLTAPTNGLFTLLADGSFTYQPGTTYRPQDTFTYEVTDGQLTTGPITVTLVGSRPLGDANGDGLFNSSDLVMLFQIGEYEDGIARNSTFADGDWNGDEEFNTADLVAAFQAGTYRS
ncbi:MAG: tandem-95 repeat protein [Planctomycetales bacterium]|nr:tandem-95 repeat protein [Planctomycetales bacterium]MCA9166032.1 tandem-95 repeat protein [Planctomycetales bacterium]